MSPHVTIPLLFFIALCVLVPVASGQSAPAADSAPVATCFTQDQLLADLTRQLTERFQTRGDLQLDLNRPWAPLSLPAGSAEVVVVDWPVRLTSSLLLQVRLQSGGQTLGNFSLMVKAQLFRDVWVTRAPIERGVGFDPNQLDTRRVDVLQQRDTVPTDSSETDFTYVTNVPAGRLLVWRDLTRRSLIRKGQIVEVSAIDGTLTITTKALAMENGAAGDTVRLRNIESKKDFSALVVAEARAQVRF
jgi:flagellar basal body P-ring formation protein FlgA